MKITGLTEDAGHLEINGEGGMYLTHKLPSLHIDRTNGVCINMWIFVPIAPGFATKWKASLSALRFIWLKPNHDGLAPHVRLQKEAAALVRSVTGVTDNHLGVDPTNHQPD